MSWAEKYLKKQAELASWQNATDEQQSTYGQYLSRCNWQPIHRLFGVEEPLSFDEWRAKCALAVQGEDPWIRSLREAKLDELCCDKGLDTWLQGTQEKGE